jgi:hypothetical protein
LASSQSYWKDSRQLGLIGDLAHIWESFIRSLAGAGIVLEPKEDELRWSGGDGSGYPTVKKLYKAASDVIWGQSAEDWVLKIWKWQIELKMKCFFWLLMKKKILTWDALVARGWEGPGFCVLCRCNQENALHLFVTCPFTQQVWTLIEDSLEISLNWRGDSVADCLTTLNKQHHSHITLPAVVCWVIWLERNTLIFNGGSTLPMVVAKNSLSRYKACKTYRGQKQLQSPEFLHCYKGRSAGSMGQPQAIDRVAVWAGSFNMIKILLSSGLLIWVQAQTTEQS